MRYAHSDHCCRQKLNPDITLVVVGDEFKYHARSDAATYHSRSAKWPTSTWDGSTALLQNTSISLLNTANALRLSDGLAGENSTTLQLASAAKSSVGDFSTSSSALHCHWYSIPTNPNRETSLIRTDWPLGRSIRAAKCARQPHLLNEMPTRKKGQEASSIISTSLDHLQRTIPAYPQFVAFRGEKGQ